MGLMWSRNIQQERGGFGYRVVLLLRFGLGIFDLHGRQLVDIRGGHWLYNHIDNLSILAEKIFKPGRTTCRCGYTTSDPP